jgi:hypothetical protein
VCQTTILATATALLEPQDYLAASFWANFCPDSRLVLPLRIAGLLLLLVIIVLLLAEITLHTVLLEELEVALCSFRQCFAPW